MRQMALKPLSRTLIFVIIGDPAPPFDRQEIRDDFSSTEVPYLILLPRAQASPLIAPVESHLASKPIPIFAACGRNPPPSLCIS
jgi:hypothetical protein